MMRLENKAALITGGYGGMGRASARLFAKEGAIVFIAGRNEKRGGALAAEINEAGGKAHFVELDVVKQEQWDAAVTYVKEQAGALVDGGWFSSAPYLTNERSHHMLQLLDTKDKAEHLMDNFLKLFR
jgi:NAD(P)-dependent dehydrogenase (short-subunit alcohol dehydrogenase family)